ncbi:nicotinate phosphoribosyltransferase [Natronospira proteinivora]|uniref:Nicotinate phosphoribosyltransferase n=1 Tax=Natronospira proteinivora TaxID=1807133 RepID=A0ABT1G7P4_9GAMM|nr:nicotinate phosphoribosyltransferase [Natronospira proteinivora]MCP1727320.1 nicotinate phosphoribosyltransferase [Natronospira proteinivora]
MASTGVIPGRQPSWLLTDLYQLSMSSVYHAEDMDREAVFELFFRALPSSRNFVLAVGQQDCLEAMSRFQFGADEIDWLRSLERFPEDFLQMLSRLRFTGDVYAVPEGSVVFPFEPVIQIRAPLIQAQLMETLLLNRIHAQSVIASKAARIILSAGDRPVMDFGARKAQGGEAALNLAKCSWIAGASGTSNMEAGHYLDIPVVGTMAHSFIQTFEDESEAFRRFSKHWPETTLLVDTWDTLRGVDRVIDLIRESDGTSAPVSAIRLDSGDLLTLSIQARQKLDEAGLDHIKIVVSSSINEYRIRALLEQGAPIDAFGVGTEWATVPDAPTLDFAYKLSEFDGLPRMKASTDKVTWPGAKQVWRHWRGRRMTRDLIGGHDETVPEGATALLRPVMESGDLLPGAVNSLNQVREHARQELAALPETLQNIEPAEPYPVSVSPALEEARRQIQARFMDER